MAIQARLHFCWIGTLLPWAYAFAVLSAAERGGIPDIVLHHTDDLVADDAVRAVRAARGVRLSRLDPAACLSSVGRDLGMGDALLALHARLAEPVQRADLLRAAILYAEGGIYLDLDTVTVAPLMPLLASQAFVGCEAIVWPKAARRSRSPVRWARHLALDVVRKACRAAPGGWRAFRLVERFYPLAVNNAVMGGEAGSAFLAAYLRAMARLLPARGASRAALGPHLLQDMVASGAGRSVTVHPPDTFFPLPPEISAHWFRPVRNPAPWRVLSGGTRVVHWYASVRTRHLVAGITPDSVRRDRHAQLYSALLAQFAFMAEAGSSATV